MAMLSTLLARFILSAGCVSSEFIMLGTTALAANSICPVDFVRDAQQIFFQLLSLQSTEFPFPVLCLQLVLSVAIVPKVSVAVAVIEV